MVEHKFGLEVAQDALGVDLQPASCRLGEVSIGAIELSLSDICEEGTKQDFKDGLGVVIVVRFFHLDANLAELSLEPGSNLMGLVPSPLVQSEFTAHGILLCLALVAAIEEIIVDVEERDMVTLDHAVLGPLFHFRNSDAIGLVGEELLGELKERHDC